MEKLHLLITVCLGVLSLESVSSNQPPLVTFGPQSSNVFFEENTPIGTSLFAISARDSDSAAVTFSIENEETEDLVELTAVTHVGDIWSVNVLLKAALDRDRSPNTRRLLFKVSDGASEITGQVKLIIRDVNDNPPMFVNLPYRINLTEGTSMISKTVLVASVTDPDDGPGGSVMFSMVAQAQGADETYKKTFVIPNENMGDIIQGLELDYETRRYYQYQIFAKDRGNPQCPGPDCYCSSVTEPSVTCAGYSATFIVIVEDVQDTPPYFERLPYITEVRENVTVGTSFFQVYAQDGDRGVPNAVTFSIVNGDSVPFTIEADTGILRVGVAGLDSDQPDSSNYMLTVMASEVIKPGEQPGGETSATTQITIIVDDINDNAPVFSQSVYHAKVLENTPRGVPLTLTDTIEVRDKDQNTNSQFKLSVEKDGAPYTVFSTLPGPSVVIQGMTSVMITVFNYTVLDYEVTKNISFQLRATENSTTEAFFNTATVIVTIEDMNDNSPVFLPGQTTSVTLTEHQAPGHVLAIFRATDADDGDYGTVSYSLEDGLGKFAINNVTGQLYVTADVDREEPGGTGYSLVVVATDNMAGDEAQRRSTRLNIRVTVLDINDNAPIFQLHAPIVSVQENAAPSTALMTLTASDKDAGVNSDVIYKVVSIQSPASSLTQPQDLFDIQEKTGVIFVNASLLDRPGDHNVTVVAFDSAADPKSDYTSVVVHVQDVNINKPVFVVPDENLVNLAADSLPNITVNEEEPAGTLILVLKAEDSDTGDNGRVFYKLEPDLPGHFTYFSVDSLSGNLTNRLRLDREEREMYQIKLKAEDYGSPTELSTVIEFRVFLRDVNDNDPEFPPPATLTLSVGEELEKEEVGFVNKAQDADHDPGNTNICYYIYGGEMVEAFYLTKPGQLRILKKLDRDVTPVVNLIVKASANCEWPEDHFTASNTGSNVYSASDKSLLQVAVEVIDINDNPPVFDDDALTVGLLYDRGIGFEVINLATFTNDEDTPANSMNYFRLLSYKLAEGMPAEPSPPFAVSRNGSVFTTRLFRADENGYFVLRVQAFDSKDQKDEADVTIYLVSDVQRVKLVFNKTPNEVEQLKGDLVKKLSEALNMTVVADKIATHITTDGKADPQRTDMYIHARRKSSEEIVPVSELWNAFDYNHDVREIFLDYTVTETLPVLMQKQEDTNKELEKAFIIVAVILAIICIVLAIVLFNTIRRYRRRLRAATTSAFVSRKEEESNSYVPPGTNKYYAAENPLFGKDMKPMYVTQLGNDNDNDSLDDNAVDNKGAGPDDKDKEEEQEMYLELYDDDTPGMHINHLAMVLQEYERDSQDEQDVDLASQVPPPFPQGEQAASSDKGSSTANGHVKSDSGFNEREATKPGTSKMFSSSRKYVVTRK